MKTSDTKLKELIEKAESATQGARKVSHGFRGQFIVLSELGATLLGTGPLGREADAILAAESNSDTIKSICNELLEARRVIAFYGRADLLGPKEYGSTVSMEFKYEVGKRAREFFEKWGAE